MAREPWPRHTLRLVGWWRDHGRISRESLYFVSRRLGTSLMVWLLVGIALALPAGLWLVQVNLAEAARDWEGRPGLSVYLEVTANDQDASAIADALRQQPGIGQVSLTTRDDALSEFREFAGLGEALDLLDENPLPASVRAVLAPGAGSVELEQVADFARQQAGVDEVVMEQTWLERLNDISQVVSRLGSILGVMFAIGAVLVTSSSVRLAIESRLEELRVLKLVGATAPQIRRPFLYFGAFYGLGGGVIAAMLIAMTLSLIETPLAALVGSYGEELNVVGFDPRFLIGLLTTGLVLGVAGAVLAAGRRLDKLEVL